MGVKQADIDAALKSISIDTFQLSKDGKIGKSNGASPRIDLIPRSIREHRQGRATNHGRPAFPSSIIYNRFELRHTSVLPIKKMRNLVPTENRKTSYQPWPFH